jgi:hypothetical protein
VPQPLLCMHTILVAVNVACASSLHVSTWMAMQVELSDVAGVATVKRVERSADHESRIENHKEDEALRKRNADAVAAGVCVRAWGVLHAVGLCKHVAVVCGRWQASLHTVAAPQLCGCCRCISNKPIQITPSTRRSKISSGLTLALPV